MELFSTSPKERETYTVEVKYSLLWEAALGIAAITNEHLISTLAYTDWTKLKDSLSRETLDHLDKVQQNNTWKTILQLLHERNFDDLSSFLEYVRNMEEEEFRYAVIPYLGDRFEKYRVDAAKGKKEAVERLQAVTQENTFLPSYILFISQVDLPLLKEHIQKVMTGWFEGVIEPQYHELTGILERDYLAKESMKVKLDAEVFVEWATEGIHYVPEPSVHKVILIPHFIYRPWNVEADLPGAKVYYYPCANESIHPNKKDIPNQMLVQKFKALGDENRLRLLKLLMKQNRSLQVLTDEVGMGKTTVYHHLKLLKSARLVSSHGSRYKVNSKALEILLKELELFLGEEQ